MEPGENIYSFLCIYDHIIVGMYHGQSRQPLLISIDALMKLLSLLSVLADLSHMKFAGVLAPFYP